MVTTQVLAAHPDVARRFVRASLEGWKSYLKGDPAPANALIKADNPKMGDAQIAFGIKRMNQLQIIDGGDAKTMGIGIMTAARLKASYKLMGRCRPAAEGDRLDSRGFTIAVSCKDLKIMAK